MSEMGLPKNKKQHVSTHVHGNLIQVTNRLTNIQTESLVINNLFLGSVALENQRSPPCTCSWVRHERINHDSSLKSEVHKRGNTTTTNTRGNVRESVIRNNHTTHGKCTLTKWRTNTVRTGATGKGKVPIQRIRAAHVSQPTVKPRSTGAHAHSHSTIVHGLPTLSKEDGGTTSMVLALEDGATVTTRAIDSGVLKTDDTGEPESRLVVRAKPILTGAEAKYGLALAMAVFWKRDTAPRMAKRVAAWQHGKAGSTSLSTHRVESSKAITQLRGCV